MYAHGKPQISLQPQDDDGDDDDGDGDDGGDDDDDDDDEEEEEGEIIASVGVTEGAPADDGRLRSAVSALLLESVGITPSSAVMRGPGPVSAVQCSLCLPTPRTGQASKFNLFSACTSCHHQTHHPTI